MKIICLGDSLTEGYGIQPDLNWPHYLNQSTKNEVINKGISGDTTSGMLARFVAEIVPMKPDVVIFLGGTNDVMCRVNFEVIIANIVSFTRMAKHHQIIPIIGIPPRSYEETSDDSVCFATGDELNKTLEAFRKRLFQYVEEDVQLNIDFSVNLTELDYEEDGVHPTVEGRHKMMKNVLTQLNQYNEDGAL